MRNDFFKYLLLGGGGSASRVELESETLPYTFTSNSYRLRNYHIYGNTVNGESVGDLVTEGEHAGEYLVPVTVGGKNLFDISTVTADAFINVSTGVVTPSSTSSSSVSDFIPVLANENYIFSFDVNLQAGFTFIIAYYDEDKTYLQLKSSYSSSANAYHYQLAFTPTNNGFIRLKYSSNSINMQVEKGSSSTPYEPYHAPVTTNIYLPAQIKIIGNETEYVDFKTQKQYFADGTVENVTLPEIAVYDGENEISIDTTVQPSKIYLQGHISETEVLSSRSMQSSPQMLNLQPLDKSELQLNDFSENSFDDLNELEQGNQVDKMSVNDLEIKAIVDEENAEGMGATVYTEGNI